MKRKSNQIKDSTSLRVTKIIVFVLFVIYALSLLFPFAWMIFNSFKTNQEFYKNVWAWPQSFNNGWKNFISAMSMKVGSSTILMMALRSVYLSIGGTVLSIISALCVSYVVAKYNFPGRNVLYFVAVGVMLIPAIGSTSTTYKLISDMNLLDNPLALLLLDSGGFGFQFLLLYSAFRSISPAYKEAASIDGAGDFTIFSKIMVPMVWPTIAPLGRSRFHQFLERLLRALSLYERQTHLGGGIAVHGGPNAIFRQLASPLQLDVLLNASRSSFSSSSSKNRFCPISPQEVSKDEKQTPTRLLNVLFHALLVLHGNALFERPVPNLRKVRRIFHPLRARLRIPSYRNGRNTIAFPILIRILAKT
jgi:ABC-type glycerol-3-phosphate transport system permease component